MNKIMYCITHDYYGETIYGKKCVWVSCPPPELPVGWELLVSEPSVDEMEQINQNAQELELELA